LHDCICCPDPCYEPKWLAIADSAFFVDAARPQTQTRLRWDTHFRIHEPDRAEFFYARERPAGGKGPNFIASRVDNEELSMYTEGATATFGLFVEMPYHELEVDPAIGRSTSGFGDLNIGTKSLLLDCELTQLTFQFKTYIPTGDFTKGLGTNHVSLEPSLLFNLKLCPHWYIQGQFAYWIPVGGDNLYQGNVFHCHFSLNHILWRPMPDVQLVGTVELNEWTVLNGNFTDPVSGRANEASTAMLSMGPGLRLFICDRIDFGCGSAFALTSDRWADEVVRAEFRWRF
jgi:hypothetical protein